jgi:hypothetical protein
MAPSTQLTSAPEGNPISPRTTTLGLHRLGPLGRIGSSCLVTLPGCEPLGVVVPKQVSRRPGQQPDIHSDTPRRTPPLVYNPLVHEWITVLISGVVAALVAGAVSFGVAQIESRDRARVLDLERQKFEREIKKDKQTDFTTRKRLALYEAQTVSVTAQRLNRSIRELEDITTSNAADAKAIAQVHERYVESLEQITRSDATSELRFAGYERIAEKLGELIAASFGIFGSDADPAEPVSVEKFDAAYSEVLGEIRTALESLQVSGSGA